MSLLHTPLAVPDIDPGHIVDFDFFAVQPVDGDLQSGWARLHAGPEIFYTPRNGGHWVFTRAEDIAAAWQDHHRYSNVGVAMSREQRPMMLYPGETDPPFHTAVRGLVSPLFSQKAVQRVHDYLRQLTTKLVSKLFDQGRCEFQSEVARKIPIYAFLRMMDLPQDDAKDLLPAAEWLTRDPDPTAFVRAFSAMMEYLMARIAERQGRPGSDFISHLLQSQIDGRDMQPQEVLSLTANVMFGGLDTVVSSMGFFMHFLATHPEHRRQLVEQPDLMTNAIEEMFRRHGIANFGRMVVADFEYKGLKLRAGDLLLLPAALYNLDERVFEHPLEVDFRRPMKHHMAFGTGIHRCIGAQLARLEMRVFLEEWMRRIPDFSIGEGEVVARSGRINSMINLPLKWKH